MIQGKIRLIFEITQSWEDFKDRVDTLNSKEKGLCFEQLTKFYLI